MQRLTVVGAAVMILASVGRLGSAGEPTRLAGDPCLSRSGQTNINLCEGEKFRKADVSLNQAYKSLLALLGEADRVRLKAAQRAWVAFRDAECKLEANPAGGSMDQELMGACLADLTNRRIADLKEVRHVLAE